MGRALPVDGIGGSVKRSVWNEVKKRKCTATCADEFVAAHNKLSSTVQAILVPPQDFILRNNKLEIEQVFTSTPKL